MHESTRRNPHNLPTHSELCLPLIETLSEHGGDMRPMEAIAALANKLGIPDELRDMAVESGRGKWAGRRRYVWKNRVAWARMTAVEQGLIDRSVHGCWRNTPKAREMLTQVRPGIVLKVYETPAGTALWATAEAAAGVLQDGTINLVFTSPPYKLEGCSKAYGNLRGSEYIEWMLALARDWRRVLVDDGSLVLNLGDVWEPGRPEQSLYQERLLLALVDDLKFHLQQKLRWYNPCKLATSPWVTQQRIRLNASDEAVFWLGKTVRAYADPRSISTPHSDDYLRRLEGGKRLKLGRPSGHGGSGRSAGSGRFRDTGGAIARSVMTFPHARADDYVSACDENELVAHPARMPAEMATRIIKLTTRPGDVVFDPFCGSNVVGRTAEELGRRYVSSDRCLEYVAGSALRHNLASVATADIWSPFGGPIATNKQGLHQCKNPA